MRRVTAPDSRGTLKTVMRTIEAIIEQDGTVELLEPIRPRARCRAVVLILEDEDDVAGDATLSEAALARDWARPEEVDAWASLQPRT